MEREKLCTRMVVIESHYPSIHSLVIYASNLTSPISPSSFNNEYAHCRYVWSLTSSLALIYPLYRRKQTCYRSSASGWRIWSYTFFPTGQRVQDSAIFHDVVPNDYTNDLYWVYICGRPLAQTAGLTNATYRYFTTVKSIDVDTALPFTDP